VTTSAVAERTRPAQAGLAAPEQRGRTEIADQVVERIAACAVAEVDDLIAAYLISKYVGPPGARAALGTVPGRASAALG
jgi:hypothetical protein